MSRLWNSLIAKLWPLPPGSISLSFTKNSIVAIRAVREGNRYCITHVAEETLPFTLFSNAKPSDADCVSLSQAMQRLATAIPQSYWPLQIALADPAAVFQIMEFDSLPSSQHDREAIAKFRFEKEFPAMQYMRCATQVVSEEAGKSLLLAVFIQNAWLECLNAACRSAGWVPSVIDITMSHVFNRLYADVQAQSKDGVFISVERDFWSILFWDTAHYPRFVRSRWRDESADTDVEHDAISQDVERLIKSYLLRVHGRKIDQIFLCARETEYVSLAARFDARMSMPCVRLDITDNFYVATGLSMQNISSGVLAAAVPRI